MNTGLAIGHTAVGVTLAAAWTPGRRPALLGVGAGVTLQGLVLLLLVLRFLSTLSLAAFENG